jgi:hypothetical protein
VTTPAIDTSVAVLRALLTEDMDTFRRLHAELGPDQRRAFAVLLGAAFTEAVTRRFGSHHTAADIVEFVAEARASQVGAEATTAADAEKAIRAALGEDQLIDDLDARALAAAQTAMLFALANETDASRNAVDTLLAEAAAQAEAYLRRRANQ